jgi:RNA-directed DNA polymerase
MCRLDTLWEAYRQAKANGGAPGVDGQTFKDIEQSGVEEFLESIQDELRQETYAPLPNREKEIPKDNGKTRKLGIPAIRDRVVQGAMVLILEPIFEADLCENTFGYRVRRTCGDALHRVTQGVMKHGLTQVIDVDLSAYFDNIRHHLLLKQLAQRINDGQVMALVKKILRAQGKIGVPQGGPLSCLLANVYLAEVDRVFEKAEGKTRLGQTPRVLYTRYVDDIVILVGKHPQWPHLLEHVLRRLKEELAQLDVNLNEEKTKVVDLKTGGNFAYLGFDCRLATSHRGKQFLSKTPRMKKRKQLVAKVREIIRRAGRKKVNAVIQEINPVLKGWVDYFRMAHASRTFRYVKGYVERRVRRFAMRQRSRRGFGWKKWSNEVIYGKWGLFSDYKIRYYRPPSERGFLPIREYGWSRT